MRFLQRYKCWAIELVLLNLIVIAGTIAILAWDLDLRLGAVFYHDGWPLKIHPAVKALYRLGAIPALLIACWAALIFLAGLFAERFAVWRRLALYLVLVYLIGPGLIVNVIFKAQWGRPRPIETSVFGGSMAFQEFYQHGMPGHGKSFPSGHASAAFFLATLYCVLRDRKSSCAYAALAAGILYGILVGAARMAAGGHYLSDILWAGYFTLLIAFLFAPLLDYQTETGAKGAAPLPPATKRVTS